MTVPRLEIVKRGVIAFPDMQQIIRWKKLPSMATCLKNIADAKGIAPIKLTDNTVNKLFSDLQNDPARVSDRSLKKK